VIGERQMETGAGRLRGAALVCAAAVCWSLGGLFVRLVGADLDGWTIAFWRSAFMVLAVGGWLLAAHGLRVLAVYRAMGWAGVLAGLLLALSFVMFILAITHTSVANAVVLQSAAPLASAVLGRVFLREKLAAPTLVAILVAVAGIATMFAGALGGGDLLGNALALGVAIAFGANIVVVRAARGLDLVPATVLAGLFAMAATLPLARLGAPSAYDLALLAAMGTLQLGLGLFLFMRGAPHLTAAQVGLLSLLEVILAPIWVWLAFAEVPAPLSLIGGAIVLSALVVHSALSLRRSKPPVGMA
jgi:drug/metabolite transporter (DMT)-like permease